MKTFRLLVAGLFVATLFAVSAFAQAEAGKIAVINTYAFGDAKAGITKYMNAVNALDKEFQPAQTELQTMATRYQSLQAEIKKLQGTQPSVPVNQTAVQAKIDEYQKLERDIKFKQEDAKARFDSRQAALLGPVMQDIGKALQDFAKQKGYVLVLDAVKLEQAGLLLGIGDDKIDVTKDFIAFYNARPAGTATSATPK